MSRFFDLKAALAFLLALLITSGYAGADPQRRLTEYEYDARGRLSEERLRLASDTPGSYRSRTVYTYDALSNRISATSYPRTDGTEGTFADPPLVTRYFFSNSQFPTLLTKEVDPDGYAVVYTYNSSGQPVEVIGPFLDATPTVHTDDPSCNSAGVACAKYGYSAVAGVSMISEVRTKIGPTACRRQTLNYHGAAKRFAVQSATSQPSCTF